MVPQLRYSILMNYNNIFFGILKTTLLILEETPTNTDYVSNGVSTGICYWFAGTILIFFCFIL